MVYHFLDLHIEILGLSSYLVLTLSLYFAFFGKDLCYLPLLVLNLLRAASLFRQDIVRGLGISRVFVFYAASWAQ